MSVGSANTKGSRRERNGKISNSDFFFFIISLRCNTCITSAIEGEEDPKIANKLYEWQRKGRVSSRRSLRVAPNPWALAPISLPSLCFPSSHLDLLAFCCSVMLLSARSASAVCLTDCAIILMRHLSRWSVAVGCRRLLCH